MSGISTHVLDLAAGKPAAGITVSLESHVGDDWAPLGGGVTDADGRCRQLVPASLVQAGVYRLLFEVEPYFKQAGVSSIYPHIAIVFRICEPGAHFHLPVLLSPNGYTTYRGT